MAEVTGKIGEEFVEFDNAATETTLQDLLAASLLIAKSNNIKNDEQKQQLKKLSDSFKQLDKEAMAARQKNRKDAALADSQAKKEAARKKKNAEDEEKAIKSQTEITAKLEKRSTQLEKGFSSVLTTLDEIANLGDSIVGATKMLKLVPLAGQTLATGFGIVANSAEKLQSAFVQASSVGANFGGSVITMVNAAGKVGITFDQFSGILAKSGEGLARLAEGSADGAIKFAKIGGQMRKEMTNNGLADLGYTTESANENMARFITRLGKTGKISQLSAQQLANTSSKYLKNLDALSKVTGKSKEALQAEQDAMMANAQYRTALAQIGDENTRTMVETLIGSLEGDMKVGFKEIFATGTATSEAGQKVLAYMSNAGGEMAELGKKLRAGGKLTEDEMATMYDSINQSSTAFNKSDLGKTAGYFIDGMNKFVVDSLNMGTRETDIRKEYQKNLKHQQDNEDATAKDIVAAKQKITDASNEMAKSLTNLLPQIEPIITSFMGMLTTSAEFISKHGKLVGMAFMGLAATIAGLKFATLISKFKSGLSIVGGSSAAGGIVSGGSGVASKAAVGFGKSIGAIGKGLGQGVAGVLKGLAMGLQAFANPQILIGAGILSGAIIVIGAGIAGATWILGKALPTFAEGLSAFGEIDGGNLLKVGAGIAAIGVAMAVMGAGAVVGTFGSSMASLSEGITHFFGGKTPLDRLVEFSNLPIKLQSIKDNTKAVSIFSEGMAALSRIPSPSITKGIADTVSSFFESNAPYERIVKFSNLALGPYTEQNVIALRQFAEASAIIKNIPKPSIAESLANTISTFLGFDLPYAKLVKFSNLEIGPNTAKNAKAMGIFAEALSSMPEIKGERAGGVIGAIASFFAGDEQMPWDKLDEFSKLKVNQAAVIANAMALSAFGKAVNLFDGDIPKGELFSPDFVENINTTLTELAGMSVDAAAISANLQGLSSLDALSAAFDIINSLTLDTEAITTNSDALSVFRNALLSYNGIPTKLIGRGIYDDMATISNTVLDVPTIINNSNGMTILSTALRKFTQLTPPGKLYQQAFVKDLREIGTVDLVGKNMDKNAKVLTTLGNALSWFDGFRGPVGLFGNKFLDNIQDIVDLNVDIGSIKNNAKILEIIGGAISSFDGVKVLSELFKPVFLQNISELSALTLDIGNAKNTAEIIETFHSALSKFNNGSAFESSGIDTYNTSLKSLGKTLNQLTPDKVKLASNLMTVDPAKIPKKLKESQISGANAQLDGYKKIQGLPKGKTELTDDDKNIIKQGDHLIEQLNTARAELRKVRAELGEPKVIGQDELGDDITRYADPEKEEKFQKAQSNYSKSYTQKRDFFKKNRAEYAFAKRDEKALAAKQEPVEGSVTSKKLEQLEQSLSRLQEKGPIANKRSLVSAYNKQKSMYEKAIEQEKSRLIQNQPTGTVRDMNSSIPNNSDYLKKIADERSAQRQANAESVKKQLENSNKKIKEKQDQDITNSKIPENIQDNKNINNEGLNNSIATLNMQIGQLIDINRRQLAVQQGLSTDAFSI